MPALHAKEFSLTLAVSLLDMSACGAALRGVGRVDVPGRNTVQMRFVDDKETKLSKRPVPACCPVLAPNPGPQIDPLEVFKGNPPLRAFRAFDKLLTDAVVDIRLIPRLFVVHLAQSTFGAFRASALQFLAAFGVPQPFVLNCRTLILRTVAVGGEADDAAVNAEELVHFVFGRVGDVAGRKQVPLAALVKQVRLAFLIGKQCQLVVATGERHRDTPVERPDGDNALFCTIPQNALIVGNRAVFLEYTLALRIQFVAIRNFAEAAYSHLRRHLEPHTNVVVHRFLQVELIERLALPSVFADRIARSIGAFHRRLEACVLRFIWKELELSRQFHALSITHLSVTFNWLIIVARLPMPEGRGFRAGGVR